REKTKYFRWGAGKRKEDHMEDTLSNNDLKKTSQPLSTWKGICIITIRKTQAKATKRNQFTPTQMEKIKSDDNKCCSVVWQNFSWGDVPHVYSPQIGGPQQTTVQTPPKPNLVSRITICESWWEPDGGSLAAKCPEAVWMSPPDNLDGS
ncbi:hypothetical protein STEG23_004703, partial [Scotinomys teguina]